MSQDLKEAIEWARETGVEWRSKAKITLLADAAQKWLDAQPKPQWIVRIWFGFSSPPQTTEVASLQDAKDLIDAAVQGGALRVEIEHPQ